MKYEEKQAILVDHCHRQNGTCQGCLFNTPEDWCGNYTEDDIPEAEIDKALTKLGIPLEDEVVEIEEPTHNVISSPSHYCREGAMECIDEMILLFGKEVVKSFCLCNIWKYRYRSTAKNGEEDIKKSDEYIRIYERLCNG